MTQAAVIGHIAVLPTLLAILMMFFLSYLLRINDPPVCWSVRGLYSWRSRLLLKSSCRT